MDLGELVGRESRCDLEDDLVRRHLVIDHRFHRLLVSHCCDIPITFKHGIGANVQAAEPSCRYFERRRKVGGDRLVRATRTRVFDRDFWVITRHEVLKKCDGHFVGRLHQCYDSANDAAVVHAGALNAEPRREWDRSVSLFH